MADAFLYDGEADHFEFSSPPAGEHRPRGRPGRPARLVGRPAVGPGAGLLACGLAATDPNLAAFAALLSMDLGLGLFATAAAYALWEYGDTDASGWFYLAGLCLGLALAASPPAS